jgi:hypothetical protein
MQEVNVKVKGIAPYFFSKPTKDGTPKTPTQEKQVAYNRVYCTGELAKSNGLMKRDGNLYVPAYSPHNQIKGCIIKGVFISKLKIERSVSRAIQLIKPCVFVEPRELMFQPLRTIDDVLIIELPTMVDQGKQRWNLYPYIGGDWELEFTLKIAELLDPEFIRQALESGGLLCGIGARRPENGRFEVLEYELQD